AGTTEGSGFCYLCRYQTLKIINQKSQDNDNNESLTPPSTKAPTLKWPNIEPSPKKIYISKKSFFNEPRNGLPT
ncbi:MAG: hypothetical protein U9N77_14725, partial [Thermodesulfobacteriota bacterium]|nr:hypothetical protein [Thermodesulfobacteriota bacterium]